MIPERPFSRLKEETAWQGHWGIPSGRFTQQMKRALLPEGHSFFSPGLWLRWQEGHSLDISFQSHHFLPAAEDQDVAPVPLFPFCLSGKGPGAS